MEFSWRLNDKESTCNTGDITLTPWLERFPGEGNDDPLQYSCLKNPMNRGVWVRYSPKGRNESDMTEHTRKLYTI